MAYTGRDDETRRDTPGEGIRDLMRGLRDFVTQIADPTAQPRPQPLSSPGRRPPRTQPQTATNTGVREPIVDIFDEGAFIRVVADMPGVDPQTLKVRSANNQLAIVASGPARRYERVVTLPAIVDPAKAAPPTIINGVMEVLLPTTPAVLPAPAPEHHQPDEDA